MKSNFEKKYGKYAIKNLTFYLIVIYVMGYLMSIANPTLCLYFTFDPYCILNGEIWRIFTWLLIPPEELGIFTIIMLLLYYNLGSTLEKTWGEYRYNLYLFSGFIFTVIGAFIIYGIFLLLYPGIYFGEIIASIVTTYYINLTIFLAFAVSYPDMELLFMFIIPVKIKWIGILDAIYIVYNIYRAFMYSPRNVAIAQSSIIIASLLNFLIFWLSGRMKPNYVRGRAKRKREFNQKMKTANKQHRYEEGAIHKCVICGRTDVTNPELNFRYCSKCSGSKEYCQDHLFTHEHK